MDPTVPEVTLQSPEMDRLLTALSDHQRRMILLMLRRADVVHEPDVMVRGPRDAEEESEGGEQHARTRLGDTHLPKLVEAGYVEWDEDTGAISKGPNFEEVEPLLELMENHADELPADWP